MPGPELRAYLAHGKPLALFCYGLVLGPIAVGWILLVEPVRFGGPPEGRE